MYLTTRLTTFTAPGGQDFVCNAHTGEVALVSAAGREIMERLRAGDDDGCPRALVDELRRRRFLFDSADDEERAFRATCTASWDDFRRRSPRHYTFIVNTHCNFRCPYCFEAAFDRPAATLTEQQIDAAFRVIDRQQRRPSDELPQFEIFGGEPLLPGSRAALDHLMGRVTERGFRASLQTNGYYLEANLDFFVRHQAHIGQVQVTLDGPAHIHNQRRVLAGGRPTFDRIVAGVDALLALDLPIRVNLRMNVDRDNAGEIAAMAAIYAEKGWTRDPRCGFIAAPVDNRCGTIADPSRLLRWDELFALLQPLSADGGDGPFDLSVFKIASYFRHWASAIRDGEKPHFIPKVIYCEAAALKLFAFHPDGRIYPCPETVGVEKLAIGTYAPSFTLDRRKARPWRAQTILARERCRGCDISTFCGGGCVLTALMQNGSMAEPVCENAHEVMELYFDRLRDAGA